MDINDFTEAQKPHYIVVPKIKREKTDKQDLNTVPFVRLFGGEESELMVHKRWELFHQLHNQFHLKVNEILDRIEKDIYGGIFDAINCDHPTQNKASFTSVFLLGSDSTTKITTPQDNVDTINVVIEMTPKESPNVRMMLRRSMFKLLLAVNSRLKKENSNREEEIDKDKDNISDQEILDDLDEPDMQLNMDGVHDYSGLLYDLTLLKSFQKMFHKNLKLILNFKHVDSFYFQVLEDFIWLLKSSLDKEHIQICLIFNINTNISNFEKNLKQETIRLLKKDFKKIDLSHNKGYYYSNHVFKSFLNTVDGKLNLSAGFVRFLMDKMINNTGQRLHLLIKVLDYSLMSYFFQNPYSVFIDLTNIGLFDEKYLENLLKCQTLMDFIEGLIKEHAPSSDIISLLENKDRGLEDFFADFLVRDNPINRHFYSVIDVLETKLGIYNYDMIDLYYHLLTGKLADFLSRWKECKDYQDDLKYFPVNIIFQELFTLDNNNGLLSQALFPHFRSNLEDNLLDCDRFLPPPSTLIQDNNLFELRLNKLWDPPICQLFKLYREANALINVYDFFIAFKEILPKDIISLLKNALEFDSVDISEEIKSKFNQILNESTTEEALEKIALVWFIQSISECQYLGIFRTHQYKSYEAIEKIIWRGI